MTYEKLSCFLVLAYVFLIGTSGCTASLSGKNERLAQEQAKALAQAMNSLKGRHISDFIRVKGPATQVVSDSAGGQIYIWIDTYQRSVPTIYPSRETKTKGTMYWNSVLQRWEYKSETVPSEPLLSRLGFQTRTSTLRIMLYTRASGTIYHWLID